MNPSSYLYTLSLLQTRFYSDPVAYRIEPLLMSQDANESDVPQPMYLTVPGQDVRLHVKAMQIGDVVRKSLFDQRKSGGGWGSLLGSLGSQAVDSSTATKRGVEGAGTVAIPLGGKSNRVDFCLQPYVIDSEYIR
jgi:hypothetical protein